VHTRRAKTKPDVPDWVDILLASTLASWATVMIAIALATLVSIFTSFHLTAVVSALGILVWVGTISFFVALFASVILGLPALGVARLLKLDKWWQAAIIGALASVIFMVVITGGRAQVDNWNEVVSVIVLGLAGVFAGIAAWRERRKGSPPA
jgi:hypothetical protein